MKTIYLMRHGETLFNTMGVNQGQCDSPLTENGRRQALAARRWFEDHGVRFDSVYSSTSERACDTAEIVAGTDRYTRLKGLKEIFLGTWEATPVEQNPHYPYGSFFVPYGGEDLDEFTERVRATLLGIARDDPAACILVVSHGMAIKRFLESIGHSLGEGYAHLGNCGIVELSFDGDTFGVEQIIDPCA